MAAIWLILLKIQGTAAFQLDRGTMVAGSSDHMAYPVLRLSTGWERFIHVEFDRKNKNID